MKSVPPSEKFEWGWLYLGQEGGGKSTTEDMTWNWAWFVFKFIHNTDKMSTSSSSSSSSSLCLSRPFRFRFFLFLNMATILNESLCEGVIPSPEKLWGRFSPHLPVSL